ncbi:hypothetical protein AWRI1499_0498 [Brettanomyces bruxellensis AWRI1499]|nr:hypothetical protein AWRI1499_0498 [Brettanomyces bruxellensis AWRI1499]
MQFSTIVLSLAALSAVEAANSSNSSNTSSSSVSSAGAAVNTYGSVALGAAAAAALAFVGINAGGHPRWGTFEEHETFSNLEKLHEGWGFFAMPRLTRCFLGSLSF